MIQSERRSCILSPSPGVSWCSVTRVPRTAPLPPAAESHRNSRSWRGCFQNGGYRFVILFGDVNPCRPLPNVWQSPDSNSCQRIVIAFGWQHLIKNSNAFLFAQMACSAIVVLVIWLMAAVNPVEPAANSANVMPCFEGSVLMPLRWP